MNEKKSEFTGLNLEIFGYNLTVASVNQEATCLKRVASCTLMLTFQRGRTQGGEKHVGTIGRESNGTVFIKI